MDSITPNIHQLARIPDLPPSRPKNLFDILGIRHREVQNSKMMAFFFAEDEEHGLGRLFLEALLALIAEKYEAETEAKLDPQKPPYPTFDQEACQDSYSVAEEVVTSKADAPKRLDLLLQAKDDSWAILIENKLYHTLENPLQTYWDQVDASQKVGIVLSLHRVSSQSLITEKGIRFLNLIHLELVKKVQSLFKPNPELTHRALFYLQEYIETVYSHYPNPSHTQIMNEIIAQLIEHREDIKKLRDKQTSAANFLYNEIKTVMAQRGFQPSGQENRDNWNYFENSKYPSLKMVIKGASSILTGNRLFVAYEIHQPNNRDEFVKHLRGSIKPTINQLKADVQLGQETNSQRSQLAFVNKVDFMPADSDFTTYFRTLMEQAFFTEEGIVETAEKYLEAQEA